MPDFSMIPPEIIRTLHAAEYRDDLEAFICRSVRRWQEMEAAEQQRKADLAAHLLGHVWEREEESNG